MTPEEIKVAAQKLLDAEVTRTQTGVISVAHPDITMDEAYAIQDAFVAAKEAGGAVRKGWKIGLTSRAMQMALGIDIPDSGILFADMFFDHDGHVPKGRFIEPRIEAEIAFILGEDLAGADVTREAVLAATDWVAPAIEILDTRIKRVDPDSGAPRKVFDTIADNAANAGIVLGDKKHSPDAFDLRWVGAVVARDGTVEETGLGAGVLNDPTMGIVWLVQRLAQYGQGLSAGDVVLSGSFIRPIEAPSGSVFAADYGAFGRVDVTFD
ncbi:2-oxo-hept-4-ene-1,7-dioate hydratase [Amylibacter sp. IMCC11727]|uniref:2-oxo-hept-4-ene-1,7-dioate hydratase n=1 Tax=Amylibacter sp. IMCC11727 TaxID=3039851 RepID=UPI00244DAB59|nr:2-oxo-hepta-3-ene-1,7-dioic acid hydratase [Amylibacter sp. IMCC11727]WGI21144.1 2-oxo-hepta-3-ene-1,7-dioic acid hydratase [Amylibacter sp. IMCC11727]